MTMRQPEHADRNDIDHLLTDDAALGDVVGHWAGELRSAVMVEMPPATVSTVADMASAASLAAAASVATATGATAAGATSGGQAVTSFFATAIGKFVASATIVTSLGAAGAAGGALPDALQSAAADAAAGIGIEIPRPATQIEVDMAGDVFVETVDGVLSVVDLQAELGWEADVRFQDDTTAIIDFVSDSGMRTVTIATDTAGEITSFVDAAARDAAETQITVDAGVDATSASGADSDGAGTTDEGSDSDVEATGGGSISIGGTVTDGDEAGSVDGLGLDAEANLDTRVSVGD